MEMGKVKKVHFIGIGGIGVSAIAAMLLLEGREVSGSDLSSSRVTEELEKNGAKIFFTQQAENVPLDADLVVFTVAITSDNPELMQAKKLGMSLKSYPEMLGIVSKDKFTVAVSGTHGKTTTTAMLAKIAVEAGLDPTVIVGSLLNENGSNFIAGKSKLFIVEADEYRRSFLNLSPNILIITNIDADHLDYYKNLDDVQAAFAELASRVPSDGFVVTNIEHPHVDPILDAVKATVLDYATVTPFDIELRVSGEHNRLNAKAAYMAASTLGVPHEISKKALESFTGTWRRFEYKGKMESGAVVYDDYAHNPHKVRAAIAGAKEKFPDKQVTVVFQPHLYSRTKQHLSEFADSLSLADRILIAPIFAAREIHDASITSHMLAEKIKVHNTNVLCVNTFEAAVHTLVKLTSVKDVVVLMGAGDIYTIADKIIQK